LLWEVLVIDIEEVLVCGLVQNAEGSLKGQIKVTIAARLLKV
jgi:hypothetical protein